MKKFLTLLAIVVTLTTFAQAPQGFNYQATVRNSSGVLITNQNVYFKFNIMLNSQTSVPIYTETHYVPTDDLGQVNLVIGTGTASVGTFATISWGTGSYFLGIELKVSPSTTYVPMGTTQLLSVPYAMYANSAGSSQSKGKTSIYLTGNITNAQAAAKIAAQLGPETENIYIWNTTQLTTVDLSALVTISNIKIEYNANLTNVNFNNLTTIEDQISFYGNIAYNSLSFPLLTYCYEFQMANTRLNSINIPLISYINNFSLSQDSLSISPITALNFPSLLTINEGLGINGLTSLASVSFPNLTSCRYLNINYNPLLASVLLPALTNCTNLSLGGNALSTTKINSLLRQMLTVTPASGKDIDLNEQTPLAPPTGLGITDKQTLINNGNSVTTD
ncbi:hypothetical protein MCEGE10_02707 [Flavobacteriaceae bacterium]